MKKRIIILMVSITLLLLSALSFNAKIVQPIILNKKYEKKQQKITEDFIKQINENGQNNTNNDDEQYITVNKPKNDQELCRTVIGKYFHYINDKEYEQAYNMLNDKFKMNNFETLEKYIEYCDRVYSDYKVLEYVKYERRSDFLLVNIKVMSLSGELKTFNQNINIAEKENNKYDISFGIEVEI